MTIEEIRGFRGQLEATIAGLDKAIQIFDESDAYARAQLPAALAWFFVAYIWAKKRKPLRIRAKAIRALDELEAIEIRVKKARLFVGPWA